MNEIEVLKDQIKSLQAALIAKEGTHIIKIDELKEKAINAFIEYKPPIGYPIRNMKLESVNLVIDEFNKTEADSFELTPPAEINRLLKALECKNRLIADFKRYDEERKRHIRRLEKKIVTLRNKNQELNKRINEKNQEFDVCTQCAEQTD